MRDTSYISSEEDGIFCRISASCSVHMYSSVHSVYMYSATPARTGGWCHCLEWTGEDMVQTSGSRPIRGQGWQRSANHSLGWRDLVLRTVSSVHWPSHSSSIIQAQQDSTAQPQRRRVQTSSDSRQLSDPSDK